jgi:hypothetical protein
MEKVDHVSGAAPAAGLDEYMDRALRLWYREEKDDSNLQPLLNSKNTAERQTPDTSLSQVEG